MAHHQSRYQTGRSPEKRGAGFTIVEIIIVAAISSLLMTALVRFLVVGFPLYRTTYLQQRSTESARLQLKRMSKALREARAGDDGSYPLVEMLPQRMVFFSDIDADATTERIRYELNGTNFERGITEPTGDPPAYDPGSNEEVVVLTSHVRNGSNPIFTYYSGDYPADQTALTPVDLTEVKYIEFLLTIDADPAVDPPPVEVVSQVQLRNLKENLGDTVEE